MKNKVVKSIGTVFVLSLIAKAIAFIRTIIQASYFGATNYTDAFNIANGVASNILYMLTTAISVAFVPLYIQKKNRLERSELKKFSTKIVTVLLIGSIVFILFLEYMVPIIIKVAAPTYEGELYEITVNYLRVLLVGYSFSLLVSLYQNLLNSEKIYGYANISSIINSVVLIVIIISFADSIGVWALVLAVLVSYCVQFLVLYAKGSSYAKISVKYGIWDSAVKILMLQAAPILLSQATVEINQVVDKALLLMVEEGAVTAVSYAAVLYQFVTGLINVPLSTVMFTELSDAVCQNNEKYVKLILSKVYKIAFIICIPIMITVFFCSYEIVSIVYGHGNFSDVAIYQTQKGLVAYIICIIPATIKSVLTRAYYAYDDTKRPMIISICEVLLNITLSVLLVKPFGILGIVGATAISSLIFMVILMINFNKKYVAVLDKKCVYKYYKEFVAGSISFLIMLVVYNVGNKNIFIDFGLKSLLIAIIYFVILIALREEVIMDVIKRIRDEKKAKFKKEI